MQQDDVICDSRCHEGEGTRDLPSCTIPSWLWLWMLSRLHPGALYPLIVSTHICLSVIEVDMILYSLPESVAISTQ